MRTFYSRLQWYSKEIEAPHCHHRRGEWQDDKIGFDEIKNRVNQVPQFEMIRLCKAVKEDLKRRNPLHESTDKKDFIQQNASICYIALKEGILPSVLYLICIMNFQYIKD